MEICTNGFIDNRVLVHERMDFEDFITQHFSENIHIISKLQKINMDWRSVIFEGKCQKRRGVL